MFPQRFASFVLVALLAGAVLQCTDDNPLSSGTGQSRGRSWYIQNPIPTSNSLLDVEFIGEYEAWAVGAAGTLLHTTNGGQTWHEALPLPVTAADLFFLDHDNGWAVGGDGMILYTDDGGYSWDWQASGTDEYLTAVTFINHRLGWAVGDHGLVLNTTDGGRTWELQYLSGASTLYDVLFVSDREGWAVGSFGVIVQTDDGGVTWNHVDAGIPVDLGEPYMEVHAELDAIASADQETITIVGEAIQWDLIGGIRLRTDDGGDSWDVELTNVSHSDVKYVNETDGWIVGYAGTIFKTADRGVTWELFDPPFGWSLSAVSFSGPQIGCAVGSYGMIVRTDDGGQTWTRETEGSQHIINDIFFADSIHGWVAALDWVYRTDDGGETWEPTESTANWTVYFLDSVNGWACDADGNFDRTRDGGLTWTRIHDAIQSRVYDMVFIDSLTGWVCGSPAILRTDDGGLSFTVQWSGARLWGIDFVDSLHGWAAGYSDSMLFTNDGGVNWQTRAAPVALGGLDFVDSLHGWAVGGPMILGTPDGGLTWELQAVNSVPLVSNLSSIKFVDTLTGWAVGDAGTVFNTIDGGQTWTKQTTPTSSHLFSVWATDPNNVWAAGWFGVILHTTNGGR
jgi:photosystem II stability/assembly factor-like uncharacterized protein